LCGVARAEPAEDFSRFQRWLRRGMAGEMRYLTDRRAEIRRDPRELLAGAKSVICVGKLYNTAAPALAGGPEHGGSTGPAVSRYAWGKDYHDVVRRGLEQMVDKLKCIQPFEWRICVDTAPLLERSYARLAGLGWIGKNTCLINEPLGSWFFLGEILTSLDLAPDSPPPDRCGTCTRCIDACPTRAIVPEGTGFTLDSRRCIAYLTIELRGPIPEDLASGMGEHVFGCDVCQEVCPWNSRAPLTEEADFERRDLPPLEELAEMSEEEFREFAKGTPLARPKYAGFIRNVRVAMGNRVGRPILAADRLSSGSSRLKAGCRRNCPPPLDP
jgi:epoxyqueuosine reductase